MVNNYVKFASYVGAGNLATYTFPFKIKDADELLIMVFNTTTGLPVFVEYGDALINVTSVTFDAVRGGGSITLPANLPVGQKIYLKLGTESPRQEFQFREQQDFKLKQIEQALDYCVTLIQRLFEKSSRSFSFDDKASYTTDLVTAITTQPVPAGIPVFDVTGKILEMKTVSDILSDAGIDPGGGGSLVAYDGYSARFGEIFTSVNLQDTLDKIINITYTPPTITLGGSSNVLREKGASVSGITLTATVTKRSDPIAEVRFYQGITLLDTNTGTIPAGGVETYVYAPAFTDNISFSAQVDDNGDTGGPTTVTANTSYSFVYPYYYGAAAVGRTPAQVAALTKDIIVSTATRVVSFTAATSDVFYFAYPASYGALTSILDVNGFETIGAWTLTTSDITGLDATAQSYRIYAFNNPVVAGSYQYTFKR